MFFVSVADKGLRSFVSSLESTLVGSLVGVASKWVTGAVDLLERRGAGGVRRTACREGMVEEPAKIAPI
jgi:hypothetical protein